MLSRDRSLARRGGANYDTGNPGNDQTVRHGGALLTTGKSGSDTADSPQSVASDPRWSFPPSAPLPSLTSALSRRAALFGAVTATGFLGSAGAAALGQGMGTTPTPSIDDPIVEMYQTAKALRAVHDHPDTSIDDADAAYDGVSEMRRQAFAIDATTPAGALASLQWARSEFAEYYVEHTDDPDWLDIFALKLIDSAIAVLQAEVTNG